MTTVGSIFYPFYRTRTRLSKTINNIFFFSREKKLHNSPLKLQNAFDNTSICRQVEYTTKVRRLFVTREKNKQKNNCYSARRAARIGKPNIYHVISNSDVMLLLFSVLYFVSRSSRSPFGLLLLLLRLLEFICPSLIYIYIYFSFGHARWKEKNRRRILSPPSSFSLGFSPFLFFSFHSILLLTHPPPLFTPPLPPLSPLQFFFLIFSLDAQSGIP